MKSLMIAAVLTSAIAGPAAADVMFTDSTFAPADYTGSFNYTSNPANSVTAATCLTCGVAGSAGYEINFTKPVSEGTIPVALFAGAVNSTFSYNPGSQGVIAGLSASVDKNFTVSTTNAFNNTFRPIIEQNGQFYSAIQIGTPFTGPGSTGYIAFTIPSLAATDFNRFDFTTGAFTTDHPDFAGTTLLFGVGQVLGGSNGTPDTLVTADFDNLTFGVTSATAVPEPSSLALLALPAILMGAAARRRRGRDG